MVLSHGSRLKADHISGPLVFLHFDGAPWRHSMSVRTMVRPLRDARDRLHAEWPSPGDEDRQVMAPRSKVTQLLTLTGRMESRSRSGIGTK